ncbi:MAG: hypothetical protein ACFE9Y_16600 [Promethearchaeota archaeon]
MMEEKKKKFSVKDSAKKEDIPALRVEEELSNDQNIKIEVIDVFDNVFEEILDKDLRDNKEQVKVKTYQNNSSLSSSETEKELLENTEKNLKDIYETKIKELSDKSEEFQRKYQKLEEISNNYEDKNRELIKKRKEYEQSKEELIIRIQDLDERKRELQDRDKKLQKAREQFLNLNTELEEKKKEFERRENNLIKIEKTLEKSKYELEKDKIDFKKEKLEFEIKKKDIEDEILETGIEEFDKVSDDNELNINKERKFKGKAEFLFNILQNLCEEGFFQSSFLIDSKGMLISEYNDKKRETMAIGAMFSLICTSALRTVKSLNLQELIYLKLSSTNGEFMAKNININNYERNFILLTYFDKSTPTIPKSKKIDKKITHQIMKNIKNDFKNINQINKIPWILDKFNNEMNYIKSNFESPLSDLELVRVNKINETSIKIRELFDM